MSIADLIKAVKDCDLECCERLLSQDANIINRKDDVVSDGQLLPFANLRFFSSFIDNDNEYTIETNTFKICLIKKNYNMCNIIKTILYIPYHQ